MSRNTPITIEDFTADYGYSTGLINFDHLCAIEQIYSCSI